MLGVRLEEIFIRISGLLHTLHDLCEQSLIQHSRKVVQKAAAAGHDERGGGIADLPAPDVPVPTGENT